MKKKQHIIERQKGRRRKKQNLWALLVGIDNYPPPVKKLKGCINDINTIYKYLEDHCQTNSLKFKPKTLKNSKAIRQGIINGFNHFNKADSGDICVFHFSGHGSQIKAPSLFREQNYKLETIVCYDSRDPYTSMGDLCDKELSYLIWRTMHNKEKVHFLSIMDCCHSGTNTKNPSLVFQERAIRPSQQELLIENLLGYEEGYYNDIRKIEGQKRVVLQRGSFIQLSACHASQTAKELNIGGKAQGVFTFSLIEILRDNKHISYQNLLNQTTLKVKNFTNNQSPQIDSFGYNRRELFLIGEPKLYTKSQWVSWDRNLSAWILNMGKIHGISQNGVAHVEIKKSEKTLLIESVFPDFSLLKDPDFQGMDKNQIFEVKVMKPKISVAFSQDSDKIGIHYIKDAFLKHNIQMVNLLEGDGELDSEVVKFWIHAKRNSYYVTNIYDEIPLIKPIKNFCESSAIIFLNNIEAVIHWHQTLSLSNPQTSIPEKDIEIELFRLLDNGKIEARSPPLERIFDPTNSANVFQYAKINGVWQEPAYRLKVTNKGSKTYWISALNLEYDFEITNRFLVKEKLEPGESVCLLDKLEVSGKKIEYDIIPLNINENYRMMGFTEVKDYVKILVSTEPLNTDQFLQNSLIFDNKNIVKKGFSRELKFNGMDWICKTVMLIITWPKTYK